MSRVEALRSRLLSTPCAAGTPDLLCITGASGVGKTSAVARLRDHLDARVLPTLCFDSLGVPTVEAMATGWDSPRGWQKAMTWHWVSTARNVFRTHPLVVLEGQFDPQYAIAACSANRMRLAVVLLHAADSVRSARLAQRGQPELATDEMVTWARYLHETTRQLGGVVVDAETDLDQVVDAVCSHALTLVERAREN